MKFAAKFLTAAYQDPPCTRYNAPDFEEWRDSLQFPITVYRGLGFTRMNEIRTVSSGIYWSTQKAVSEGFAEMSASEFGHEHYGVMRGVLESPDDVDWDDVEGNWTAGPEFELLLFNGTSIHNVQLSVDGGPYKPFKKSVTASGFKSAFLNKVALPTTHRISLQDAQDKKFFGPVYHGTTSAGREAIDTEGFKIFEGEEGSRDIRNGYRGNQAYSAKHPGVPAPVHHLGFGIYFTTSQSTAKMFNENSTKGLKTYYLDVPNYETINFAAPHTMMSWWIKNGYDPELAKKDRVAATKKMTEHLKSQWDAVWFKGQGLRKLLDGDQICVYDPNRVYEIDPTLAKPGDIGSKVRRKSDGMRGVITKRENIERMLEKFPAASSWIKPGAKWRLNVKWQKGGTDYNVQDVDVDFL